MKITTCDENKIRIEGLTNLEDTFKDKYFTIFVNGENAEIKSINILEGSTIELVAKEKITDMNLSLKIDKKIYNVTQKVDEEIQTETENSPPAEKNEEISFTVEEDESNIYLVPTKNGEETTASYMIESYIKENYPDFIKSKIEKNNFVFKEKVLIQSKSKGHIYLIYTKDKNGTVKIKESDTIPLYYFSNVKSLKEDIANLAFEFYKTDDEYKKLIAEKSTVVKTGYGINSLFLSNLEIYPILKRITNLYCIKDLLAFTYIDGSSPGEDGLIIKPKGKDDLKLGDFSYSDKSGSFVGNVTSMLHMEAINRMIKEEEKLLQNALTRKTSAIYGSRAVTRW